MGPGGSWHAGHIFEIDLEEKSTNTNEDELTNTTVALQNKVFSSGKLTMKQKNALWQLVQEFSDVFVVDAQNLRVANLAPHEIDVQGHRPISCALRRASPEQRKEISRQVKQLLEAGIISPSYSPWSSPLVLVRKKDGTTRMCVDYRKLNAVQKKDAYPLPLVADALDLLGKQRWFTALDACSGYHQIPVHPRDRELTAFRTPDGSLYQYNSLSFGLCNAPASFQRAMDSVFADIKWDSVFVYLDDIIVFSKTFEDHLKHLREVLSRARKVDLQFKIKKCFFAKEKLQYLGHTVSADGITPDEANTDKIRRFPVPNSKNLYVPGWVWYSTTRPICLIFPRGLVNYTTF